MTQLSCKETKYLVLSAKIENFLGRVSRDGSEVSQVKSWVWTKNRSGKCQFGAVLTRWEEKESTLCRDKAKLRKISPKHSYKYKDEIPDQVCPQIAGFSEWGRFLPLAGPASNCSCIHRSPGFSFCAILVSDRMSCHEE